MRLRGIIIKKKKSSKLVSGEVNVSLERGEFQKSLKNKRGKRQEGIKKIG